MHEPAIDQCGRCCPDSRGEQTDVLQDNADPNRIFLYEVDKDEQALEAHRQTPHFQKWREAVKDWFDGELQLQVCSTVFPTEQAWQAVKPS